MELPPSSAHGQAASQEAPGNQFAQPTRQISDLGAAIEIMRQLNPQCNNDQLLYRMLTAHINGEPLELTPEEMIAAGGRQILVPLPKAAEQATKEVGFRVKHSFQLSHQLSDGSSIERECLCVKVVDSPEVLAVTELFTADELDYLREAIECMTFEPALSTTMKVRVEGEAELHEFVVPNDSDDMCLSSPTSNLPQRNCEVAFINRQSQLYQVVASRLPAVHPRDCPGAIQAIAIERYLPNQFYEQGHFSHQRYGAVLVSLESLSEGGISLTSVGLQLNPLAGMGLWIPSRYGPPVPDLRTDFAIHNPNTVPLHYIVAWIGSATDQKEVVQEGDSAEGSEEEQEVVEADEDETTTALQANVSPEVEVEMSADEEALVVSSSSSSSAAAPREYYGTS